jgi:hypothetical protein
MLSKRLKTTEISGKPCTDHICVSRLGLPPNDVTRTRAHKNKVKVAVNRLSDSFVDLWIVDLAALLIIPIPLNLEGNSAFCEEGNTSLTDTRGHTLTTVAQTHTVLTPHGTPAL